MKNLFASFFFLAALCPNLSSATELGRYACAYQDQVGRTGTVSLNLDTNEFLQLEAGSSPTKPANWKKIFSKEPATFCGYRPANPGGIECDFETEVGYYATQINKLLTCVKGHPDGSASTITTGTLYFNNKTLDGTLRCTVRTTPAYNLKLSKCEKN